MTVIIIFILLLGLYKAITFFLFIKLRKKLQNADLPTFKKLLSNGYRYKTFSNGVIRCMWVKGWITVKADFDKNGKASNEKNVYPIYWGQTKATKDPEDD